MGCHSQSGQLGEMEGSKYNMQLDRIWLNAK